MTPRLLVTGVTGLLGSALVRAADGRYEVHGLARDPHAAPASCPVHAVDLREAKAVARLLEALAPDIVVHTAALTAVDLCETEPALARAMNVESTRNLLRALQGHACRFVLVSTDAVFDGTRGRYAEDDPPAPISVYGRTKLLAEEAVLAVRQDALVVRTVFYGWNVLPKQSLAEWILGKLRAGDQVPGLVDLRFSPLFADTLAGLIYELIPTHTAGPLHLASTEGCSKYEFARRVAETFGFPQDRITATRSGTARLVVPRSKDLTLCVGRAAQILGRPLPGIADGLREMRVSEAAVRPSVVTAGDSR